MLRSDQRVVLLQHGGLDNLTGKTGLAMLRHRQGPIVAVIDPDHAGQNQAQITGIERDVPVVKGIAQALEFAPEVAVIGLAPSGGGLPEALRADALKALASGLNLASGLHTRLADDPAFQAVRRPGCWIWDLRCEPSGLQVGQARAAALPCQRLLAVGTDMAVGKMSACLELLAAARRQNVDCRFVGTGQAGILIAGAGVALDAVRVDYAAGAVEAAVLESAASLADDGLILVEGQGSLCHPASTATLPLLRGSQATDLVLVHRARQECIKRLPQIPLPPLRELLECTEALARLARPFDSGPPARVKAVALNTSELSEDAARQAVAEVEEDLNLPCTDPIRWCGEPLLEAVRKNRKG